VQVYSGLVLLIALTFPVRYDRDTDVGLVVLLYVLAKVFEILDKPIFSALRVVSGHTLKHLAAAAAGWCILRMVRVRRALPV
jgi:hypothetical protein